MWQKSLLYTFHSYKIRAHTWLINQCGLLLGYIFQIIVTIKRDAGHGCCRERQGPVAGGNTLSGYMRICLYKCHHA